LAGETTAHAICVRQQNAFIDLLIAVMDKELVDPVGALLMISDREGAKSIAFG
jgi:hypothetical protein